MELMHMNWHLYFTTRLAIYVLCNMAVLWHNHCCYGKEI